MMIAREVIFTLALFAAPEEFMDRMKRRSNGHAISHEDFPKETPFVCKKPHLARMRHRLPQYT